MGSSAIYLFCSILNINSQKKKNRLTKQILYFIISQVSSTFWSEWEQLKIPKTASYQLDNFLYFLL